MSKDIKIASGEHLSKVWVLEPGKPVELPENITLEGDAKADLVLVILPGVNCDQPLQVKVEGQYSEVNLSGLYLCNDDEKVKLNIELHHQVPNCTSHQLFKGIAAGKSHFNFYGKIIIAQDAQKTEAYQENHNILLTDEAKVDTKPQLEIYADDVKATHGATIGRLNEEEQFYMRSRGISEEDAKMLQMISFVYPVIDKITDQEEKERIAAIVEDSVRSIAR